MSKNMLNIIGLGLNIKQINKEILEAIKNSDIVYLESYTSYFYETIEKIQKELDKKIIPLSRKEVEQKLKNEKTIIEEAKEKKVSLLIIGDPLSATTHSELLLEAKKEKIETKIYHNVSVINAITNTGLEIYKFGKTASIVFPRKNWFPKNFYEIIKENKKINAHTLLLLDIITTEEEIKNLDTKIVEENIEIITTYDNNKMLLMTPNQAIKVLLKIEEEKKEKIITEETKIFVCSRLQQKDEKIITGTIKELKNYNFGKGPHSIIIPSKMHFIEEEFYNQYKITK